MTEALFRKVATFLSLRPEMEQAVRLICNDKATFGRYDRIIDAGEAYRYVYLVERGWASRYKYTADGRRQIVNFALAGDFLCFNAPLFEVSDYVLAAHTELEAFVIPIEPFSEMLRLQPRLAMALAWANAHEEALIAERIVSIGRRDAIQRTAHLFCELWRRLEILDLAKGNRLPLPLTREDLADSLGISTVHVSRTLGRLREKGLIAVEPMAIRILDMQGLERIAGFDDSYLHFTEAPTALSTSGPARPRLPDGRDVNRA